MPLESFVGQPLLSTQVKRDFYGEIIFIKLQFEGGDVEIQGQELDGDPYLDVFEIKVAPNPSECECRGECPCKED